MIVVHGMSMSGNCQKVRQMLELAERPYRWIEVDSARGGTRTPAFLAKNPNGRVPIIEREDGSVLAESNAILCWLADGTPWLPADPWQRAQALAWMFFEQYSHEPYIAVARYIRGWTEPGSPRRAELPRLHARGHEALAVMERHLASRAWFTGEAFGVADIALHAYTDVAHHGGFDLAPYPAVRGWLERVRATPGYVPMPEPDVEAAHRLAQND